MIKQLSRVLALLVLLATPALAQIPMPAATPAPPPANGISADDLQKLVGTLQNEQDRDHLVKELQGLIAAENAAAPPAARITPETVLDHVSERLEQLGVDAVEAARVVVNLPYVAQWARGEFESPEGRAHWATIGRHVGFILGGAVLADLLTMLLVGRLRARLRGRRPRNWARRLSLLTLGVVLEALPVIAFALAAYGMIAYVDPRFSTRMVAIELTAALLLARLLLVLARAVLLMPREAGWAILPVTDETAQYLYIWMRRFVVWAVYGFGLVGATWWLGVPGAVYVTLQKSVALVLTVLGVVFVLQNRQPVAVWLRPNPLPPTMELGAEDGADAIEAPPPVVMPPRYLAFRTARRWLAGVWHILMTTYLIGIFCVYALRVDNGFTVLLRDSVLTILLLVSARLLVVGVQRTAERGFAVSAELKRQFPTLEPRANRYLPILTVLSSFIVWGVAVLSLFEVWGVASYAWLETSLGRKVTGSALTIALILAVAFVIWEILNAAIDRYLTGIDSAGGRIARSARIRTLLPLFRNAAWFTLALIVVLLVMSELGLNIAPLLEGAGVVGLAIGFGSQALVKDVITGMFMLIEDTIAVGDVVDFGNGHNGVIEAISVRTVKLRDQLGTVHTLPFSEITSVKNMTREYAWWLIDIAVPYNTDTDRVMEIYREITAGLRKDKALGSAIVADLDPIGITALGAGAIQVQARIKTRPLHQWAVGREFNRRLKQAFDAARIYPLATPPTLTLGKDVAEFLVERGPVAATPPPLPPAAPPARPRRRSPKPAPQSTG